MLEDKFEKKCQELERAKVRESLIIINNQQSSTRKQRKRNVIRYLGKNLGRDSRIGLSVRSNNESLYRRLLPSFSRPLGAVAYAVSKFERKYERLRARRRVFTIRSTIASGAGPFQVRVV